MNKSVMIPKRKASAHKGDYGRSLIFAGSKGMCGAAYFSALAALKTGTGLCTLLTGEVNRTILQTSLPEAMVRSYESLEEGKKALHRELSRSDFVAAGPGLSTEETEKELLRELYRDCRCPLLLDADAVNMTAEEEELFSLFEECALRIPVLLTPHVLEFSRLSGMPGEEILADPMTAASCFSRKHQVYLLLKADKTYISSPSGETELISLHVPGLSKGGSGDILTGIVAGLYQIERAEEREFSEERFLHLLYAGAVLHKEAGLLAQEALGAHSVMPRDVVGFLSEAVKEHSK